MRWQGKVIGGALGAVLTAGNPIGAAVGILLGHQFDKGTEGEGADPQAVRAAFFRSTFSVMGYIAKSDGRISESEIQAARGVMQQMRLSPDQVQSAIQFFTAGKQPGFAIERAIREMRETCGDQHDVLRMFVEIQLRAALQGSNLQGPSRGLLHRIGQALGFSMLEMAHMEAVLRLQRGERASASTARPSSALADAYSILDIEPTVSDEEVVKAYRRQMSRHHPDKLVANGLPESMSELANEKTQQIREAYETIRAHRGMS